MWEPLSLSPLSHNPRAEGVTLGHLVSGAAPCPPPAMWGQWLHTARCPPRAKWKASGSPPTSACPEHRWNSGRACAFPPFLSSPGPPFSFQHIPARLVSCLLLPSVSNDPALPGPDFRPCLSLPHITCLLLPEIQGKSMHSPLPKVQWGYQSEWEGAQAMNIKEGL